MSNRFLGILIILGFIGFGIIFYMYFFVYYMGSINIKSNIEDYKVELYNKKLLKTNQYNCIKKDCIIPNISPFAYSFSITKSGYVDFVKDIEIGRNQILNLDIILNKKTVLNEVSVNYYKDKENSKNIKNNIKGLEKKITNKEKIAFLRNKNKSYFYIGLNNQNFYFKQNGNNLRLYKNNIDLGTFEKVKKEEINILEVLRNNDYILINLAKKKYLYSTEFKKKYPVNLNIDINYVKNGQNNAEFIFITTKGAFVYNKFSLKLEYFDFFRDFIYYKSGYIGVIDKIDTRRLNNLGLQNITQNLIIYYNNDSKEKKILYKTDINIQKIYKKGENIMFISSEGKEYKLNNL